jgi:hypothetical protein
VKKFAATGLALLLFRAPPNRKSNSPSADAPLRRNSNQAYERAAAATSIMRRRMG